LIKEQLREELIWKAYPSLWWKYIERFDEQCIVRDKIAECSNETMSKLNIDVNLINSENENGFQSKTFTDVETGEERKTIGNKIL
jgi:hypothetical protein